MGHQEPLRLQAAAKPCLQTRNSCLLSVCVFHQNEEFFSETFLKQNTEGRIRAGQRLPKIGGSTGHNFQDRLKRQNEMGEAEQALSILVMTGPLKRFSQVISRAYAAKHLFVCHLLLFAILWEKPQFLSAKHNYFKSMRDLSVSPEVLTACWVSKENFRF